MLKWYKEIEDAKLKYSSNNSVLINLTLVSKFTFQRKKQGLSRACWSPEIEIFMFLV